EMYRGSLFSELNGKYIIGDFSTAFSPANGALLGMEETSPGVFSLTQLDVAGGNPIGRYITAFGKDENGEIYVATRTALAASGLGPGGEPTGAIYHIVAVPEPPTAALFILAAMFLWRAAGNRPVLGFP